jgi:hypothetical protein
MAMAKVDFQMESADNPRVTPDVRKRFLGVTDVASWKLVEVSGNILYTGLIVMGPKALPDGGFQSFAELILDLPADPLKAIPDSAIPAIQNAVLTEYRRRAVILPQPGTATKQ